MSLCSSNTLKLQWNPYASEWGAYEVEGCTGVNPKLQLTAGVTYTFDQSHESNWRAATHTRRGSPCLIALALPAKALSASAARCPMSHRMDDTSRTSPCRRRHISAQIFSTVPKSKKQFKPGAPQQKPKKKAKKPRNL